MILAAFFNSQTKKSKKMGQPDEDPTAPDTRVVSLLTKLARVANGQLRSRIRIGNVGKDGVI